MALAAGVAVGHIPRLHGKIVVGFPRLTPCVCAWLKQQARKLRAWQGQGLRVRQVMDMLVEQTHAIRHEVRSNERAMRFTDTRLDEQQRGVSLKMVPVSLVMAGGKGKSYLLNLADTPGAPAAPFCLWTRTSTGASALST